MIPATAGAQKPAGDRVAGRVVNALDEHPLSHATVTLAEIRSRRTPLTTTSDDDGHFDFTAVPPGKYHMMGIAAGYVSAPYMAHEQFGTAIVTGAGLATDSLTLRLTPMSVIAGRVIDEAGDPIQRASVALYRDNPLAGSEHVTRFRILNTGDDGQFEFNRLPPGKYFLSATATPWYAVHARTDMQDANFPYRAAIDPAVDVAYPMIFFPHALDSDSASPINLRGGDHVTADMQFQPEHAVTLSLRVPSGEQPNQRQTQLMRSVFGMDEAVQIQMMETSDGVQRLPGLAPGQYKVAQNPPGSRFPGHAQAVDLTTGSTTLDASQPVNLTTVSVTVHAANGESLPTRLQLNLRSVGSNRAANFGMNDKGVAELDNVPPGDYRFVLNGEGHQWNVVSLLLNDKAVADKRLHIDSGGSLTADLTISATAVDVEGFARREDKPAPGSLVLLVPAGSDTSEALFRRDQSDLDGSFAFSNVVPGNYILVAIDDGWTLHWTDPKTLMPYLLKGLPVTITANGSATFHIPDPVSTQPR
jgi:hypothetical protein